ncbi:hypothetical protein HMPREF3213_01195 [Heyndrickxia coagulans]|uniref:Uncharacterized protein n=1 Tax=Heyndrickxia coagulans TaxID=1398 RepID=A0A133KVR3_HEYCO|nr:hypothetical protein HMPREF3213_01195 [Heyndrickxia coagulans]
MKTFKQGCEKPVYGNRPYTGFFWRYAGELCAICGKVVDK